MPDNTGRDPKTGGARRNEDDSLESDGLFDIPKTSLTTQTIPNVIPRYSLFEEDDKTQPDRRATYPPETEPARKPRRASAFSTVAGNINGQAIFDPVAVAKALQEADLQSPDKPLDVAMSPNMPSCILLPPSGTPGEGSQQQGCKTSRDRHKSAPYLRLKNSKRTSKCLKKSSVVWVVRNTLEKLKRPNWCAPGKN